MAAKVITQRESDIRWIEHQREHGYEREAVEKAAEKNAAAIDDSTEKFETLIKAAENKHDADITRITERRESDITNQETVIQAVVNRHDADYNSLRDLIQTEKEARKGFEGSLTAVKYIAGFFSVSSILSLFGFIGLLISGHVK